MIILPALFVEAAAAYQSRVQEVSFDAEQST
jgi:hypothetical protein